MEEHMYDLYKMAKEDEIEEVDLIWRQIEARLIRMYGPHFGQKLMQQAVSWLFEKLELYYGLSEMYLEKLEDNAVYLSEASWACLDVAAEYLCKGQPLIPLGEVGIFVWSIRHRAFHPSIRHQRYIRFGCQGCSVHDTHSRYQKLYKMRRNSSRQEYLDELQIWCLYHQLKFLIIQEFLKMLLTDLSLAGTIQVLSKSTVIGLLSHNLEATVRKFGGIEYDTTEIRHDIRERSLSAKRRSRKTGWLESLAQKIKALFREKPK